MADKLSNQQIDELIADTIDDIIENKAMDNIKTTDHVAIDKLVRTAQRLHAFSDTYPGVQSMQQRAIEIKQAYRAEVQNKPVRSRADKPMLLSLKRYPRVVFSALSALAVVLVVVTVTAQNTGVGLTAAATASSWIIPALIGTLVAIAGIAYWLTKK